MRIAGFLRSELRLVIKQERDLGFVVTNTMERNRSGSVCPCQAVPGNTPVGNLFYDFRIPLLLFTADSNGGNDSFRVDGVNLTGLPI